MKKGEQLEKCRMIAVTGPTAGGKSELAITLAERLGGEIISTDSLQVYRHLDIGTAKPTPAMRARVPHHLIDLVNPDEEFSAGSFVTESSAVIARLRRAGGVPVLCGGTGLYLRALLLGLADIPPVPADIRARVREMLAERGAPECHGELAKADPESAGRLHPNDSSRIGRALEVFYSTGRTIGSFRGDQPTGGWASNVLSVGYRWEREELYARINRRVAAMLENGWEEEVRGILAMGYAPQLKPLRSIGYREIAELLLGARERGKLAEDIARRTRHFAKRQITWFRKHPAIFRTEPEQPQKIVERAEIFLKTGE